MLGLVLAGLMGVAATPSAVSTLFVFGDSLVYAGNVDAALREQGQPTATPAPYFQNCFPNRYNFADVVSMNLGEGASKAYGYPVQPHTYFYGGTNFAYGAAQTRDDGHGTAGHSPSFQDQLALFATSGKTIGADDYVLITFDGNDIQQELLGSGPVDVRGAISFRLCEETGINDLSWLTDEQVERLRPVFPKSHGKPRVDDRRVLSGIVSVNRNGLRWRDAPSAYGPTRRSTIAGRVGARRACSRA